MLLDEVFVKFESVAGAIGHDELVSDWHRLLTNTEHMYYSAPCLTSTLQCRRHWRLGNRLLRIQLVCWRHLLQRAANDEHSAE